MGHYIQFVSNETELLTLEKLYREVFSLQNGYTFSETEDDVGWQYCELKFKGETIATIEICYPCFMLSNNAEDNTFYSHTESLLDFLDDSDNLRGRIEVMKYLVKARCIVTFGLLVGRMWQTSSDESVENFMYQLVSLFDGLLVENMQIFYTRDNVILKI